MEGVTQYIPKSSTEDTLQKLKSVVAPGSTIVLTYVDERVFDDDPSDVASKSSVSAILQGTRRVGEPWISGWSPTSIKSFLHGLEYDVISDTTAKDYNDVYLEPLGRKVKDNEIPAMERFVVAKNR